MRISLAVVAFALALPIRLRSTFTEGELLRTTIHVVETRSQTSGRNSKAGVEDVIEGPSDRVHHHRLDAVYYDSIDKVKGPGGVTAFTRRYEGLREMRSTELPLDEGAGTVDESAEESSLDGLDVEFRGANGRFSARFPKGKKGNKALLRGLDAQLPFGDFLPRGKVDVGSAWDVSADAVMDMLSPGGELAFTGGGADSDSVAKAFAALRRARNGSGTVGASLLSAGGDEATIYLVIKLSERQDLTAVSQAQANVRANAQGGGATPDSYASVTARRSYKGSGTVVWDTKNSCPTSIELSLEFDETRYVGMTRASSRGASRTTRNETSTGTLAVGITVERLESE